MLFCPISQLLAPYFFFLLFPHSVKPPRPAHPSHSSPKLSSSPPTPWRHLQWSPPPRFPPSPGYRRRAEPSAPTLPRSCRAIRTADGAPRRPRCPAASSGSSAPMVSLVPPSPPSPSAPARATTRALPLRALRRRRRRLPPLRPRLQLQGARCSPLLPRCSALPSNAPRTSGSQGIPYF